MSDILSITEKAAKHIEEIVEDGGSDTIGVRLSVTSKGCSGNAYKLDLVKDANIKDDVVEQYGVKVYVDPMAFMYIFGTTMDWEEGDFHSGFTFINPNEKGRCGCGESFHI